MTAFELLANNEKTSNSRYFYRSRSQIFPNDGIERTYTITFKVSSSDINADSKYTAQYYTQINNQQASNRQIFELANTNGVVVDLKSSEGVFSYYFAVEIFNADNVLYDTLTITGLFDVLPNVSFNLYPTFAINEQTGNVIVLDNNNYFFDSPGTYFYGEEHTQRFILNPKFSSSTGTSTVPSLSVAKWFVGNDIVSIINNPSVSSYFPTSLIKNSGLSNSIGAYDRNASVCEVSSQSNKSVQHPVSLLLAPESIQNPKLPLSALPIITYPDDGSSKRFYPYFASSRTETNILDSTNSKLKNDITVKTYPLQYSYGLSFPFPNSTTFSLSVEYDQQQFFLASLQKEVTNNVVTEKLLGSIWSIQGEAVVENNINPDWEYISGFIPASAILFPLSYYNGNNADFQSSLFQISPSSPTTINLQASSVKQLSIDLPEYGNWKPRNEIVWSGTVQVTAVPPPEGILLNLYTPNFFNLINTDVFVYVLINRNIEKAYFDLIESISIFSNQTTNTIVISGNELITLYSQGYFAKPISFFDLGKVSLSATAVVKQEKNSVNTFNRNFFFAEMFEIVETYDNIDSFYYRDTNKIEDLLNFKAPKLSPNEWATEDNFNSIINKHYTVISEIDAHSKNYLQKSNISDIVVQNINSNVQGIFSLENPAYNEIVFSTNDSIHLLQGVNYSEPIINYKNVDDVFQFANIINTQKTVDGKFVVLDNIVSRVSVYTINLQTSSFDLFTTWGKFGLQSSTEGFNEPQDFHVDRHNKLWIADTGNNCIKQFSITGRNLQIITNKYLDNSAPLSICLDSEDRLHVLTEEGTIFVFSYEGEYLFEYSIPNLDPSIELNSKSKIQVNYSKEIIYISHRHGVLKFFKNGIYFGFLIHNFTYNNQIVEDFSSVYQDKFRNTFVCAKNLIFKIADIMYLVDSKALNYRDLIWKQEDLQIQQNEYIQGWVYLQAFHRMWDNIELFRNILYYNDVVCQRYSPPVYKKEDLVIGQNEIVSNSIINRLSEQLWTNLKTLIDDYFNAECKNKQPLAPSKTIVIYIPNCNFDYKVTCYDCDILGYIECKDCDLKGYVLCGEATPLPPPTPTATPLPSPTPTATPLSFQFVINTNKISHEVHENSRPPVIQSLNP